MKLVDVFFISKDTFRANKLRSFLTISAVIIGIGAIVFLLSLGRGLERVTIERISTSYALRLLNVTKGKSEILLLNAKAVEDMRKLPNVELVSPRISFSSQATVGEITTESVLHSIDAAYIDLELKTLVVGQYFSADRPGAVISSTLATLLELKDTQSAIGKEIQVDILVPKGSSGAFNTVHKSFPILGIIADEAENYLFVDFRQLSDIEFPDYQSAKVVVRSPDVLQETRNTLQDQGYILESPADTLREVNIVFNVVRVVLGLFGFIALVVASIGMFNTLTISLLERTRDVGIMKSLGATNRDILFIFMTEALMMGIIGGLIGIGAGWLVGFGLNTGINYLAQRYGGLPVNLFIVTWDMVWIMMSLSVFLGLVTGLYPSWRASRLNPLWALRYE